MAGYETLAVAVLLALASPPPDAKGRGNGADFTDIVLAVHNEARSAAGVTPLVWDDNLGRDAARHSFKLALSNHMYHSPQASRPGQGENLWLGTKGAFGPHIMVGNWVSERTMFRPGRFPGISRSDNWADVGHYTQIIWPDTRRVGCALATNARNDFLVCRYWPAGNVHGVAVHPARTQASRR